MNDGAMWRELAVRVGITTIFVAIAFFAFRISAWAWLIPAFVGLMVVLKWRVRRADDADEHLGDEPPR